MEEGALGEGGWKNSVPSAGRHARRHVADRREVDKGLSKGRGLEKGQEEEEELGERQQKDI